MGFKVFWDSILIIRVGFCRLFFFLIIYGVKRVKWYCISYIKCYVFGF